MPNDEILDNMTHRYVKSSIELNLMGMGIKSVKNISVGVEKIRKKWWFITVVQSIDVIRLLVDEPLFVAENLIEPYNLEQIALQCSRRSGIDYNIKIIFV